MATTEHASRGTSTPPASMPTGTSARAAAAPRAWKATTRQTLGPAPMPYGAPAPPPERTSAAPIPMLANPMPT
jgi:hypothetical protein